MRQLSALLLLALLLGSCRQESARRLITDKALLDSVTMQFERREAMAGERADALFSLFGRPLSTPQKEALMFLYAYAPLTDLANLDGDYFLGQVNAALAARDTFSWGAEIPESVFLHFVLPFRVNNENPDTARQYIFAELKDRVKDLSLYDAALEVNHWCHEKVNYRASDGRTSAPLATIRTAWGRCGEESTLTVAALRAVGIPARQVYTPRWAHTDDNHAWVEVWVDGTWYYMGACEPEPELNMGWFTMPSKRAMMVHSTVMGPYAGSEEVNFGCPLYVRVNMLSNYAPVRKLFARVTDSLGQPVKGARVQFKLYNYAELYPLVERYSDSEGLASATTGMGDLFVWASTDSLYGYQKVERAFADTVELVLHRTPGIPYSETFDLVPPPIPPVAAPDSAKTAQNNLRLAYEDSIRNRYTATFIRRDAALELARELHLDTTLTANLLLESHGNWREMVQWIRKEGSNPMALPLLASISQKDLRDVDFAVLSNHLNHYSAYAPANGALINLPPNDTLFWARYVVSPRIRLEKLTPFRSFLQSRFGKEFADSARQDIKVVVGWILRNIVLNNTDNYINCPMSAQGVYLMRMADDESRNLFFVALCRSLYIPARLDPATAKPQYFHEGMWKEVQFNPETEPEKMGNLTLTHAQGSSEVPGYYTHFTLGRFEKGDFVTLDYENDPALRKFPVQLTLKEGYYRLMSGNRLEEGTVLMRTDYFRIEAGKETTVELTVRPSNSYISTPLAKVNLQQILVDAEGKTHTPSSLIESKGAIVIFIHPNREPSRHVIAEIADLREAYNRWGGNVLFVIPGDKPATSLNHSVYGNLPPRARFYYDPESRLQKELLAQSKLTFGGEYPLALYITPEGNLFSFREGYSIGTGNAFLQTAIRISALVL